jgi:hypothetical protein
MSENNEQSVSDDNGRSIIVGDFIKITSDDPDLNDVWCIEYLSSEKMVVLKVDDGSNAKTEEFLLEDGAIQDERVQKIELLDKPEIEEPTSGTDYEPASYLAHRHFSPDKWVEIMFVGMDEHFIGKILNVAGDSAEISIFENGAFVSDSPIVLDFNYTGLPEGVLSIDLIEDPTIREGEKQEPVQEQEEEYVVEDLNIQVAEEREFSKFRYGLEEQTNDILESMLSKLPSDKQIDKRILANINQTIVRYVQLRELFSKFDEDHNIMHYYDKTEAVNKHEANWKPLRSSLQNQNKQIGWVFPIVQHTKKIYKGLSDDVEYDDIRGVSFDRDRLEIDTEYTQYYDGNSAYSTFFNNITPNLMPFVAPDNEESSFITSPTADMDSIVGNFNSTFSNAYGSKIIKQIPFQFSRYVSTINYITQTNLTKMSYKTVFHPLIQGDTMHVKALLTLPSAFMTHSKMRLPGTDMVGRANMALAFPSYSRLLTLKTPITSLITDNLNVPMVGDIFADEHFKHYSYSGDQQVSYSQFLDYFIPTTHSIIESKKNKLSPGHLSVFSIASELEPYFIYTDDLILPDYQLITEHLQKNTKHFFTKLSGTIGAFNDLKRSNVFIPRYNGPTLVLDNDITNAARDELPYYFSSGTLKSFTVNSEELSKTLLIDCGRIFNVCCAYNAIALSADVSNIETDINDPPIQEDEDAAVCVTKIVAKKYKNAEKMQADNEIDIFFDKEYDSTDYTILNEPRISKKKFEMSADEFDAFLTNELTKLKMQDIPTVVKSLLTGQRQVMDGHYAILVDSYGEKMLYKRENNKWEFDPTAPKNAVDIELLCNSQPNCLVRKNKCESIDKTRLGIEDTVLSDRESIIGDKIKESIDAYKFKMENDFAYGIIHVKNSKIPIEVKSNYEKNRLGLDLKKYDTVVSPYAKYVDPILSHPNFEKKQDLIIRFCDSSICRDANDENEDKYWLYCSKTNTKLIPTFFLQLAHAHFQGNYREVMNVVLNERKAIDDNGTVWIDKYSGYAIKHVDLDTDEGYNDEGFKVVSRDVLDVDESEQELEMMSSEIADSVVKSRMEYDKTGQVIYGIIDTLSRHMMIDISIEYNFIIKKTVKIYKNASMTEAEYKQTKTETPYSAYLSQYLNYITLAVFLIVCQTRTPSLVPKGTFPGCVKSFAGYPAGPIEDKSGIIYLLCILSKTKFIKVSSKPKQLEQFIEIAMQDATLRNMILKKMSLGEDAVIEKEHSIAKWTSFQPVLIPFKLTNVLNVHEDFKELLLGDINSGKNNQYEKIAVLQSKIILFSYAIQGEIQKIVEAEPLILKSYESKLLNENACCNGTTQMTTLDYFKSKNASNNIEMFNNVIMEHRNILDGVNLISKAVMWLSGEKTKTSSIQIDPAFSMKTIYSGVVKHCNFQTNVINSPEVTEICGEKPNIAIKLTDTMEEIIGSLQQSGLTYSAEQLTQLLRAVTKIIVYSENAQGSRTIMDSIVEFLNELDAKNEETIILKPFQTKMQDCFTSDPESLATTMQELKQYTFNINTQIFQRIREFSRENKNKLFKPDHVDALFLNRDRSQVYFQFLKNSIINVGKIFPSMCITQTSNYTAKLPNYWGVTDLHNNMLVDFYAKLFERVILHYGKHIAFFKYIVEESSKIIEMITNIPFADNEVGFLVLEHCLLLVLDIYMTVGENRIEDDSAYESTTTSISTTQLNIMRDFIITIMGNDKHINVSYQTIVDATFRLKELEKNKLLRDLNTTKDLAIDNHFKALRIGERWGGGENVRGYNKERSDREAIDFLGDQAQPLGGGDNEDEPINDDGYDDPVDYENDYDNDGDY